MDIDLNEIREIVANDENTLFRGCFSESVVRFDMSTRREKRDYYIQAFNKFIDEHRILINVLRFHQDRDLNLIEKSKKCKNEASRLLDIVFEY